MTVRRVTFLALAAAILLGIAALVLWRGPAASRAIPSAPAVVLAPPSVRTTPQGVEKLPITSADSPLADALNAPAGTLRHDLEIVHALIGAFQTNFPRLGNPVGENAEITAALAGENPAQFRFISPRHPALNARGELCDRWGTPFRFHQVSGTRMEIGSAGPDRKFATADDVRFP